MTAGIVVDNYKLTYFKAHLKKGGFPTFDVSPLTKETSTIKVQYQDSDIDKLRKLIADMEFNFKRRN